jgi:hypothetical protein
LEKIGFLDFTPFFCPDLLEKQMMRPKILAENAVNDHVLLIEFDNRQKKKYDLAPLLDQEMFSPLKNSALFKAVQVEHGLQGLT